MTDSSTTTGNRPIAEKRDGAMKIALWRSEPKEDGGRASYQGKLTISFRDSNGDWKDTPYASGSEHLRAANLHLWAYNKELELREADKDASPSPE